jgi:capsular polysaccharide biosynthesis protein
MLPRLFLSHCLREMGCQFAVLLSTTLPKYVKQFVSLYFQDDEIYWYDSRLQHIVAPLFLLPSMMHTNYNFHPAMNLMVSDIRTRVGIGSSLTPKRKVYISRGKINIKTHWIENEAQVEQLMEDMGFEIIHPQDLTIIEQIDLFANCSIVVGEYSSALHNAIFSNEELIVLSINRINWYQSSISRLRGQRLGFVLPDDGVARDYRNFSAFRVNCGDLKSIVGDVMAT